MIHRSPDPGPPAHQSTLPEPTHHPHARHRSLTYDSGDHGLDDHSDFDLVKWHIRHILVLTSFELVTEQEAHYRQGISAATFQGDTQLIAKQHHNVQDVEPRLLVRTHLPVPAEQMPRHSLHAVKTGTATQAGLHGRRRTCL